MSSLINAGQANTPHLGEIRQPGMYGGRPLNYDVAVSFT